MKIFKVLERNQKNAHDDINANFDKLHSIGDIISNVRKDYDPNIELGGVWERFGKGRTIVSVDESDTDFSESNKTGGTKTQELTALIGNVNSSAERIGWKDVSVPSGSDMYTKAGKFSGDAGVGGVNNATKVVRHQDGKTPNNLPPYITAYVWVRVK